MRPIPKNLREQLSKSPRMKKCLVCSQKDVEWNHALQYRNRQINEWYALQPLCTRCHRGENGTINRKADLMCKIAAIEMGIVDLTIKYSKRDWAQEKQNYEYQLSCLPQL